METKNPDLFETQKRELPGMLNVLTILTFIGCGLSYISSLWSFFGDSNYDEQMAKLEKMRDETPPGMLRNMADGSIDMFQKTYEHRYLLLAVGLICTTLCLVGAIQMRKRKKTGFTVYTIGELAPLIASAAVIGFGSMLGSVSLLVGGFIAILFVILYATQRKYLVN